MNSTNIMLKFGNIFKYKEKDYVFLAHTEEILFSALILDKQMSKIVREKFENLYKQKSSSEISKLLDSRAYCFVELRTEDVKNRLAHFAQTQQNPISEYSSLFSMGQLNKEDLKQIKIEIEQGPVPLILKELTKDIVIEPQKRKVGKKENH